MTKFVLVSVQFSLKTHLRWSYCSEFLRAAANKLCHVKFDYTKINIQKRAEQIIKKNTPKVLGHYCVYTGFKCDIKTTSAGCMVL